MMPTIEPPPVKSREINVGFSKYMGTIICLVIACIILFYIGKDSGRKEVMKEALKLGFAEYTPDKDMNPQFSWIMINSSTNQ